MRRQPLHKLLHTMVAVLVPVALAAAPSSGFASDLSDAKSRLSSAVTEMDSLANDISSGQELCRAWQEELDSLADDVIASQGRVQGIAEKKGRATRFLYKSGGGVGLLDFLFASQDISELLDNFSYVEEIQSWYGSLEQEERSILEETERQIADIEARKSEQEELMLKLEQERGELASKVAEIEGQVDQLGRAAGIVFRS